MGNLPLMPKSRFGRLNWTLKLPVWKELSDMELEPKPAEGVASFVEDREDVLVSNEWMRYTDEPLKEELEFDRSDREAVFTGFREWELSVSVTGTLLMFFLWADEDSPQETSVSLSVSVLHPTKAERWTEVYALTFMPASDKGQHCGSFAIQKLESGGWLDTYRQLHLEVQVTDTTPQADTALDTLPTVSEYLGSSEPDEIIFCAHPSEVRIGEFPDTTVVVEGYRVDTHRARLATRSTTFKDMFNSQRQCPPVEQSSISLSDVVGISLPGFAYCLRNIYQDLNSATLFPEPKEFVIDIISCADYLHMADYLSEMLTLLQKYIEEKPLIPALLSRLQMLGLSSGPAYDALSAPCRQFLLSCLSTPRPPILPSVPSSMIMDALTDKLLFVTQAKTIRSWIRKRHKEWSSECLDEVLDVVWRYPRCKVNVIEYILLLKDLGRPVSVKSESVVYLSEQFADHAPKTPQEWKRFKLLPRRIQSFVLTAQLEGVSEEENDEVSKEDGDSGTALCKRKFDELS